MKPLVSVVIPAYNAEAYIAEAIESVLNQTYPNFELIIIDDKSPDQTLMIAKSYESKDSRVKVIENEKNVGVGGNRNRGIAEAGGEYICWLDSDDISLPDRVEKQVEYLENHPAVGVVGGFITFFDENGVKATRRYAENDKELRAKVFRYNPVAQPASMVRKKCYEIVGLFNPELRVDEDLEMLFRIGEKFEFANLQQVVLKYRQSDTSLTAANLRKMELGALSLRKKYKKSRAYRYTLLDGIYNFVQRATLLMPVKMRMRLFSLVRGDA